MLLVGEWYGGGRMVVKLVSKEKKKIYSVERV
jgi:hypothetical protein